jgi:hypothetical protein
MMGLRNVASVTNVIGRMDDYERRLEARRKSNERSATKLIESDRILSNQHFRSQKPGPDFHFVLSTPTKPLLNKR